MFFITILKLCQMFSFSIYPWLKAIFRKLLRCGCFPGNFLYYLRTALPSEIYTSRWLLLIELFTVISFYYCNDFFLCSEKQGIFTGESYLQKLLQKLFKVDHLPYSSYMKLCCSLLFLNNCETVRKQEATVRQWGPLWKWVTKSQTVRVEVLKLVFFN